MSDLPDDDNSIVQEMGPDGVVHEFELSKGTLAKESLLMQYERGDYNGPNADWHTLFDKYNKAYEKELEEHLATCPASTVGGQDQEVKQPDHTEPSPLPTEQSDQDTAAPKADHLGAGSP
jgi:hypothetical protein